MVANIARKPAVAQSKPAHSTTRKPANVPAVAPVKKAKGKPSYGGFTLSAAIPDDALVIQIGDKSFFIGSYGSFTPEGGEELNTIWFTKGYGSVDKETGEKTIKLSGRSGSMPQEFFADAKKGQEIATQVYEWLLSFIPQ
jgi:hypothetical protein